MTLGWEFGECPRVWSSGNGLIGIQTGGCSVVQQRHGYWAVRIRTALRSRIFNFAIRGSGCWDNFIRSTDIFPAHHMQSFQNKATVALRTAVHSRASSPIGMIWGEFCPGRSPEFSPHSPCLLSSHHTPPQHSGPCSLFS